YATADICDHYGDEDVQVAPNSFRDYGGVKRFSGQICTVECLENNPLVRQRLTKENGVGKVLVVDGGGSMTCALMGDQIATGASEKGWSGVIINGAVRDSAQLQTMPMGCKALGTCPRKSGKATRGEADVAVSFAGLVFTPGHYVYADQDGIVVSREPVR
ncbi:unnamed protein product, partial [Phaeothamnion confervicola]